MLYIFLIVHIISVVILTQTYKVLTSKMKNAGALTAILQMIAGICSIICIPFSSITIMNNWWIYGLIILAIILYGISNRIHTATRQHLSVAEYSITQKISKILAFVWGIVLLKEKFLLSNLIGCLIIMLASVLAIYDSKNKKIVINKYIWLQLLAAVCGSLAITIDSNMANNFNIPLYYSVTVLLPAMLIIVLEKIKMEDIKEEFKNNNLGLIILTGILWAVSQLTIMYSYRFGTLTYISPIATSTVVLNSIVAYFVFKEKKGIWLKIIASILVVVAVCIMTFLS